MKNRRQSALSLNQETNNEGNLEFQDLLISEQDLQRELELQALKDMFQHIITSSKYRAIHPRKKAHCNLSHFVALKLAEKTLEEIADQLQISRGYAASLWTRKFLPKLQEILQDFRSTR